MSRTLEALVAVLALSTLGCGDGAADDGHPLKSACVEEHVNIAPTLPDGAECSSFGTAACGKAMNSDCVSYCAFARCQARECTADDDCAAYRGTCQSYVVQHGAETADYGRWCKPNTSSSSGSPCGCYCTCVKAGGSNCSGTCAGADW